MSDTIVKPPDESTLRLLLAQNLGCVELVQSKIDKFKLPYRIEVIDGVAMLLPTLSPGELILTKLIGISPSIIELKRKASLCMKTDYPVLITGETGTGKELLARAMIGSREGPTKCINCSGLSEELIESELFGHVKGAFTGAHADKVGLMQSAENGVIFLDEISKLKPLVQPMLLRAIQDKTIRPLGSTKYIPINCKIVCATNQDLKEMCKRGEFQLDLYARISTLELHVSALKDRREDSIPIILSMTGGEKFLEKYKEKLNRGELDLSLNVRSLEQMVIRNNVFGEI